MHRYACMNVTCVGGAVSKNPVTVTLDLSIDKRTFVITAIGHTELTMTWRNRVKDYKIMQLTMFHSIFPVSAIMKELVSVTIFSFAYKKILVIILEGF